MADVQGPIIQPRQDNKVKDDINDNKKTVDNKVENINVEDISKNEGSNNDHITTQHRDVQPVWLLIHSDSGPKTTPPTSVIV